jgi:CP family cyanate transporter-like MFS transporter
VVNGLNGVAANTGFALALSLTVPLSRTALGWRGTLIIFALACVALCLAWAAVGKENPLQGSVTAKTADAADGKIVTYLDVWKMKETWLIALCFTGPVVLYVTFALWLPTFYREQFHMEMAQAARYCSIILYAGIPSAIVCGFLAQKIGLRRPFLILGGALAGTAAFGVFLCASPIVIVVSAALLGVGLFIPTASLMTLLMELKGTTPRHVTLIAGTMVSSCYVVASVVPNVVGWLSDKTGSFVPSFVALTLFSWGVVLGGILLPETGPRCSRPARSIPA